MAAERELRIDQLFPHRHPHVAETGDLELGEGLVREIPKRFAAPQRERPLESGDGRLRAACGKFASALGSEPLKAVRVEAVGVEPQLVAVVAGNEQTVAARVVAARGERLSQARDPHLHGLAGSGGRTFTPEFVDQPIGAERLVGV